ncbi:MAG: HEAT repeat domain-containing protein [Proteobacteria bacterium]|nr:HEAT repeat domain-containing protein [Pseudomonadota bacterium]
MKPRIVLLLLLLFIVPTLTTPLWAVEHVAGDEEGVKGGLEVTYQNDLLSVNALNYPLRSILDEIIKQTGLKIMVLGTLDEKISVRVDNLSLDKALSKIIGNKANFVFYYSQKASGEGSPVVQLTEVKVYPQEKGGYTVASVTPEAASVQSAVSPAAKTPQTTKEAVKKLPEGAAEGADKGKMSEELIGALKSQDGEVRESAAYALAEIGDKKAVEPLIDSLDDENPWVREGAAHALAELGDKKAVEPLIKSLHDDNPWVRESAVRALGTLQDEQAIEPLKELLHDEDKDVSESASEVLKQMAGTDYKSRTSPE